MMQLVPRTATGNRLTSCPNSASLSSRRALLTPPALGDWASRGRHIYGWPNPYRPPATPEEIVRRRYGRYAGQWQVVHPGAPHGIQGLGACGACGDCGSLCCGGLCGLSDAQAAQVTKQVGGVVGAAVPSILVGAHVVAAASLAVPVIGLAIAGVTLAIAAILTSGCGETCVISTDLVNKLEPKLKDNVQAYLAVPTPRPRAAQIAALANFDNAWAWLSSSQACGASQLGDAGRRCISDREEGSCKWKDSSGSCWNWFIGYRDPIAHDTQVTDTPESDQAILAMGSDPTNAVAQAMAQSGGGGLNLDSKSLLLIGGLVLVLFMSQGQGRKD